MFTDDADASTGKVRAITGWEDAKVADPADDFAALVADAPPEAVETVLEAYSHTRVERPDANLLVRARLVAELGLLSTLMVALARKDVGAVEVLTTQLRRLDDAVHPERGARRLPAHLAGAGRPAPPHRPPPALVVDDDDEDLPEVVRTSREADGGDADDGAMPTVRTPADADGRRGCRGADGHAGRAEDDGRLRRRREASRGRGDDGARRARGRARPRTTDDEADQVTTEIDLRSDERRPAPRVISSAPGSSGQTVSPVAAWKNAPRTRCSGTPRTRAHASR